MTDKAARKRLGRLLMQARVQQGVQYKNRALFARDRGLNARLLQDIENAARSGFEAPTKMAIELAYGWGPGSIDRVLAGGDPVEALAPAPGTPAADLIREAGWDVPERAPDLVWMIAEAPADQLSDSQKRGIIGEYARQYAPRRPRQNPGSARTA